MSMLCLQLIALPINVQQKICRFTNDSKVEYFCFNIIFLIKLKFASVRSVYSSFGGAVSGDGSGSQDASRLRIKRMLARDSSPDTFLCDSPGGSVLIGPTDTLLNQ